MKAGGEAPKAEKVEDKKEEAMNAFAVSEPKSVPKKEEVKAEEPKKAAAAPKAEPSQAVKDMQKISTYNGAENEKYNWSQSISEVTVQVPLPEGTTAKMLQVDIKAKKLFVKIKGQDAALIDGELAEKVKTDDSYWSVEDKKFLNITLEKAYEAIWKTVVVGDAEIDPKTVDNSKRLEEFDTETQGHLQKVLYEQERKKMGLPTTDEEKQQKLMEEILAKANPENNPMAGLPYDPKKYNNNKMGSGSGPAPPFRQ